MYKMKEHGLDNNDDGGNNSNKYNAIFTSKML